MGALTHFDMVGYPLDLQDEAAVERVLGPLSQSCKPTQLSPKDIDCLVADASGGELHLGLKVGAGGALSIETMNPAFRGEGRMQAELLADVSDPDWKTFEITVYAHFAGEETPIVFDLAEPAQGALVKAGAKVTVQLSAFCFEPEVFADEAAYYKAQKKDGPVFAASYFIPSGTFTAQAGGEIPEGKERPVAYADFAGTVLKAELKSNGLGHERYWWALVKTMSGATIDVVLAEGSVKQPLKPGMIVTGRFWLSGRIVSPTS